MAVDFTKIERLRKAKGLSQQDAAQLAGIGTKQRWADLESGRNPDMRVSTLEAIAAALGVTACDLLTPPAKGKGRK